MPSFLGAQPPSAGAGPDPGGLRPRRLAGPGGGGPARVWDKPRECWLARAALKLAPPLAHELRPTPSVTKGAQPMSGPERPGLRAKQWEGERREGAGSRGRATFDWQPSGTNPPHGFSSLSSLLGSTLRPTSFSSTPLLVPLRPAPLPLPHSAGKSLLERGGGLSSGLVWRLEVGLTGGLANRRYADGAAVAGTGQWASGLGAEAQVPNAPRRHGLKTQPRWNLPVWTGFNRFRVWGTRRRGRSGCSGRGRSSGSYSISKSNSSYSPGGGACSSLCCCSPCNHPEGEGGTTSRWGAGEGGKV